MQWGLSFYLGATGKECYQISNRKLKISISHSVVIVFQLQENLSSYTGLAGAQFLIGFQNI